jgi:DNA-directed RNA polymerase subunit M/transcription elongation factor TFIIS
MTNDYGLKKRSVVHRGMVDSILCQGCGQLIRVKPEDLGRKIRCPDCGVLSDPPRARKPSGTRPEQTETATLKTGAPHREADSPHEPAGALAGPPASCAATARGPFSGTKLRTCPNCGQQVKMHVDAKDRRRRCPACGWEGSLASRASDPGRGQHARPGPNLREPALPVVAATEETYGVTRSVEIRCPECGKTLLPDAKACPGCGFDLDKGEKPERVFERVERSWEAGLPFSRRLLIFLVVQAIVFSTGLPGAIAGGRVATFFISWIPFTLLLLFVVGTYDRVDLIRKKNGHTLLSKTWRLCLVECPRTSYQLSEFEGVTVGKANDTNMTDWILFLFLALMGVIPAILFWNYVIRPDAVFVALTRDHGYAAETLYRGRKQAQAREIADAVHELAGLPRS